MNRHQRRAFKRQWDSQIEAERNGAPIPGDVAEMMTKPKPKQILHQIIVDKRCEDGSVVLMPVFPAMIEDAALMLAETINKQVALGNERTWTNARTVPCTPLQGVH